MGIAALACTASALAATPLTLSVSAVTVRYGDTFVVNGRAAAAEPVTLLAPSAGITVQGILSATASPSGMFHFEVAPLHSTVYTAQSGTAAAKVTVHVAPRVGLDLDGTVRVAPVATFVARPVVLQAYENGRWLTLSARRFDRNGVARFPVWSRSSTVRALVPGDGAAFVSGTSRIFTAACSCVIVLP